MRSAAPGALADDRLSVLVVEDNPFVLRLCRVVLEREGYTVLIAADAKAALDFIPASRTIALALVDLIVPGGSSAAIIKHFRDAGMTGPVVCMSGYPLNHVPGIKDAHLLSSYFLAKPFTPEQLLTLVTEALRGNSLAPGP